MSTLGIRTLAASAACVALALAGGARASEELVVNGGFEPDLSGWTVRAATPSTTDVHAGAGAALLTGKAFVRQDLGGRLVPDVPYTISAWVKVIAPGRGRGVPALRATRSKKLRGKAWAESPAVPATSGWQHLVVTRAFTAAELRRPLSIGVTAVPFDGTVLVDDVSVMRATQGGIPPSHAFGLWTPGRFDTCPATLHDEFSVVGPDGKRYPTWHPPTVVDPGTGAPCTFGHEHGRDPHGSHLWPLLRDHFAHADHAAFAGLPFGHGNEQLDVWNAANGIATGMRHEDHVGHKVEWENDVRLQQTVNGQRVDLPITCDFLMKVHQGTHSADAFTNNLHELVYAVDCSDGTRLVATVMVAFGAPGGFVRSCDKTTPVAVGPPTPPNSPSGGGVRFIADRVCPERFVFVPAGQFSQMSLAFYEDWISSNYLRTPGGSLLAYFDPHFAVFNPSRYYDASRPGGIGRVMDVCYEEPAPGLRARDGGCDAATDSGRITDVTWDDPRSPFDGASREFYFNQTRLENAGGPTMWWTDPFGRGASPAPFVGAIRQLVAAIDNTSRPTLESQAFGADRPYGGAGVHAPN